MPCKPVKERAILVSGAALERVINTTKEITKSSHSQSNGTPAQRGFGAHPSRREWDFKASGDPIGSTSPSGGAGDFWFGPIT